LAFSQLKQCLNPGDLLVVNNTRVIPARLFAVKPTGGKVEILLERLLDEHTFLAQCRANKPLKIGQQLNLPQDTLEIVARHDRFYQLKSITGQSLDIFAAYGEIPLPPYLKRPAEPSDGERYQTVYASEDGAVAAPTAGLHFDDELMASLRQYGVSFTEITLHVGSGTFTPVRDQIEQHIMHNESYKIPQQAYDAIRTTQAQGGRIISVGTTCVRALESAALADWGSLEGDTQLFIKPGFQFQVVDGLITNFHLPRSTLLVLVCAFAGFDRVMAAYHYACQNDYRFFSYGDAMFLTQLPDCQ
jgi:S-adenosylmethionine:tRNA ribosyltransferase-isomerase